MMAVSTKGRYSVGIVAFLASKPSNHVATKIEIAAAEGTSPQYVQQLMRQLGVAGLVHSKRGRNGGFLLARPPESITVAHVLRAAEGDVELVPCRSAVDCGRAADCPMRPMWMRATALLEEFFQGTTIAQLVGGDGGHDFERQA
jgi:Rrf2 family transcriptional regulator, iron-sulfur cluster assembly transcription factor